MENQCSYERYLNAAFLYADEIIHGLTEKECQERCDNEPRFKCNGVTYRGKLYSGTRESTDCALHSDDIISLGPRSMRRSTTGSVYMRRVRCLNGNDSKSSLSFGLGNNRVESPLMKSSTSLRS